MSIDAKPRYVLSHISFASLFEGGYNNTYVGSTYYLGTIFGYVGNPRFGVEGVSCL
jgi:hypothetical protein